MGFKPGVKGWGSDGLWSDDGAVCKMRWTRRRVNRMRLTEAVDSTGEEMHCILKRAVGDPQW